MKILLLNSPWINNNEVYGVKSGTRWAALRKKDRSMSYYPYPYFLASATAVLKKDGFDAHIKDAIVENMTRSECMAYVRDFNPAVLVIDAFTPSIYEDLSFMREAKEKTGCVSIFCGTHPTALPADILKNQFIDFVLLGEYDYTLRDLAHFLKNGRKDYENIKGLAYKENESIKVNPRRELIQNLDELPFPERDELPTQKYNEPFCKYAPNAKVVSTRGCPFHCIFCTEPLMCGGSNYRKRSIDLIMEEIKLIRDKYGVKEIYFDDAIITIPRAIELAEGMIKSNVVMPWSCWMDSSITFEQLKLVKKSGCIGLKFGIESSNPEILNASEKPAKIGKIKEVVKNCRKLGIVPHGSFLCGLPGDTVETMRKTIDFAFSLGLVSCQVAIVTPLPGTPFFKLAKEKGWLLTENWEKYDGHYTSVIEYPNCKKEEIEAMAELARRRKVSQFLKNPLLIVSTMIKIYRLKGFKGFFKELSQKTVFLLKALFSK